MLSYRCNYSAHLASVFYKFTLTQAGHFTVSCDSHCPGQPAVPYSRGCSQDNRGRSQEGSLRGVPDTDHWGPAVGNHRGQIITRWRQLTGDRQPQSAVHRPPSIVHRPPTVHPPSTVHRPPHCSSSTTIHHPPSTILLTIHRPPSTIHRPPPTVHQATHDHDVKWPFSSSSSLAPPDPSRPVRRIGKGQPRSPVVITSHHSQPVMNARQPATDSIAYQCGSSRPPTQIISDINSFSSFGEVDIKHRFQMEQFLCFLF